MPRGTIRHLNVDSCLFLGLILICIMAGRILNFHADHGAGGDAFLHGGSGGLAAIPRPQP